MSRGSAREIHLDTSFLIRALVPGSREASTLRRWLQEGHDVALSTEEAAEAARLFNATGRRRGSFQDCLVAATAMVAGAELATSDRADFRRFSAEGLKLVE